MKIIELEQGSAEWLEFRRLRVGASDVAAILGKSRFTTALELYELKLGMRDAKVNSAMRRGHELEPIVRREYEARVGLQYPSCVVQHDKYDWAIASLDGYNAETNSFIEIKCPRKLDHEIAMSGDIPLEYQYQIAWQFFVTGAERMYYVSALDADNIAVVERTPNSEVQKEIFAACKKFYDGLINFDPPEACDRDFVEIDNERKKDLSYVYHVKYVQMKLLESELAEIKDEILKDISSTRFKVGPMRVTNYTRRGSIDYAKIPELQHVELDKYRRSDVKSVRIDFM